MNEVIRNPFEIESNHIHCESLKVKTKVSELAPGCVIELDTDLPITKVRNLMPSDCIVKASPVDGSLWVKREVTEVKQTKTAMMEKFIDESKSYDWIKFPLGELKVASVRTILNAISSKRGYRRIRTRLSKNKTNLMIKIIP